MTPLLKLQKTCIDSLTSLGIALRMGTKRITLVNTRNLTATVKATAATTKNKREINMVGPPGFNNYIVNELHENVQNFQGGNL